MYVIKVVNKGIIVIRIKPYAGSLLFSQALESPKSNARKCFISLYFEKSSKTAIAESWLRREKMSTSAASVNLEDVPSESLMSELLRRMRCSSKPDKRLILIGNSNNNKNTCSCLSSLFFTSAFFVMICLCICVVFTIKIISFGCFYGFSIQMAVRSTFFAILSEWDFVND